MKYPSIFVYLFLIIFSIYFALVPNYEFIVYIIIAGIAFYILIYLDRIYKFPTYSLWLIAIWVALHMFGGGLIISGKRLYATMLIPFIGSPYDILKYDQFVHAYCYVAISILIYYILKKHLKPNEKNTLIVFTILAAIGIGALNEVAEFSMVIYAGAADAVGGYYNTTLDIVFNVLGAIIGTWYVHIKEKALIPTNKDHIIC